MTNIILRKFKSEDLKNLEICLKEKVIPVICVSLDSGARALLSDYIRRDMENEVALAITKEDFLIGGIDSLLVGDVLITSYFVMKEFQNQGVCTEALRLFIEQVRKNSLNVKQIRLLISNDNYASRKVACKSGFAVVGKNEFVECWEFNL